MKTQSGQTYFHTEDVNSSEKIDFAAPQHITPVMQQYLSTKAEYPDCLLFYRMGDFYELFFDDAVKAASILGIALTKRGRHLGEDVPMCGVPAHSADGYLETLIASGTKVAICEQMEDMADVRKRGSKAVMRREVVRIVTAGTITEDSLLDAKRSNYLASLTKIGNDYAFSWLDMSTGDFGVSNPTLEKLPSELARISAREIIISEQLAAELLQHEFWREWDLVSSRQNNAFFDSQKAERRIKEYYNIKALDVFGDFSRSELSACGALLEYIQLTQKSALPRLDTPRKQNEHVIMAIDPATRRNLELTVTISGERKGSLLSVIDKTKTNAGGRLIVNYLNAPLMQPEMIEARLKKVDYFYNHHAIQKNLFELLIQCPDIERALSRICLDRGGPRDLLAIKAGLVISEKIFALLKHEKSPQLPTVIDSDVGVLASHSSLIAKLKSALKEEVGLLARDGNFVKEHYSAPLDEFRLLRDESKRMIAALESRYQQETSINNLKIRYNNVLGYFAEITPVHEKKITEQFIHRQSLASALRYTTTELGDLERKISEAGDRALKMELEIFEELVLEIKHNAEKIKESSNVISTLDVASSFAELALESRYVRPRIDDSSSFEIIGGRHPVVEAGMTKLGNGTFIANDCQLEDNQRLWLLTGPNMAGKSTFLRQNAIIALLAQIGSYVPAKSAHIGVIDKIFSRVGAADDLARGRSTFMVEMVETATILHQATSRSLVILDEIGRGTATFDGLSLAWAVVEQLHNHTHCRALFATHYHEMTALSSSLVALSCKTMKVREWNGEVVFLHEVADGVADRSYGIHVAKLAGLPDSVILRASEVLKVLEETKGNQVATSLLGDLPLFNVKAPKTSTEADEHLLQLKEKIDLIQPDNLTPKEALELIYQLKSMKH